MNKEMKMWRCDFVTQTLPKSPPFKDPTQDSEPASSLFCFY